MLWILLLLTLAIGGGVGYWLWRRRRKAERMISLVVLLREPLDLTAKWVAKHAGLRWKGDFGDGKTEGPDGFVVDADRMVFMINDRGDFYMIHNHAANYFDDPEAAVDSVLDERLRAIVTDHEAWVSCDAMGLNDASDDDIRRAYRRIGLLLADLIDDNCLAILAPDTMECFAVNDDTIEALRSKRPLESLRDTVTAPFVQVPDNDPAMLQAVREAKTHWPRFAAAFENRVGSNHAVKAPVSSEGNTEFIWIEVTAIEGERIYGTLGNEPVQLPGLALGSRVSVSVADVQDWCYIGAKGERHGGYSIEAVREASERLRKRARDDAREQERDDERDA